MSAVAPRLLLPLVLIAVLLSGCAPAQETSGTDAASEAPAADPGQDAAGDGGSAEAPATAAGSGCTDGMLAYLADNGFGDVPPVDPSGFSFPEGVAPAVTPTCFVSEDDGQGASRESALFFDDPEGAIRQADAAFTAAGWQGEASESLGGLTGIWWSDGDQMTARHSVGGGVLEIDGRPAAWFTWAS